MSHLVSELGLNGTTEDPSLHTPKRRAKVWEYFEQNLVLADGVQKAVCKYCGLHMSTKSGTNSLRNHIAETCQKILDDDRKQFVATMKRPISDSTFVFDRERSRELMVMWCIHAEIPFNKFDDPYFEQWMESMQPTFDAIGRQTVRNVSFAKYERMKEELQSELQSLDSHICFTSDLWTSNQNKGYLCLTAHYVDSNFVLKKRIIDFRYVKYPHTGVAIEEAIKMCLTEWGIKRKIFTLTLDNASNNKSACDLLQDDGKDYMMFGGEHLLVRCCAHVLNILVQDGMRVIHEAIEIIRHLIRHIISSPGRIQVFNEIAQRAGLPTKSGLILDVPNRWNSTHDMIVQAVQYKAVMKRYAEDQMEVSPTDEEWNSAKAIGEFLGAFEEATKAFSASRTPTSHMFLYNVLCIHHALRTNKWPVNDVMRNLAREMDKKFDKYWDGNYNMALVIATVLDPRKKLDYLNFFYEKVCENFEDIGISMDLATGWLKKYFVVYEKQLRTNNSNIVQRTSAARSNIGSPVLGKRVMEDEFTQYRSHRRGMHPAKSELDAYLEDEFVRTGDNFEILTWWKTHSDQYPVLSAMARDFLAIPLSTVASESAFSCSGRILGDNRSSMTPETLEALVCAKDWLYIDQNQARQQQA